MYLSKQLLFILFFVAFSLQHCFSQTDNYTFAAWTAEEIAQANTGEKADFLSAAEKQLILLTNLARINPSKFANTYLTQYVQEKKMNPSDYYISSLYKTLANQPALPPFKVSKILCKSAASHAEDMGKSGKTGHDDANGTSMESRFFRFVPKEKYRAFSENCHYGYNKPLLVFMDLFIDTGVEDLGHRINILDPDLVYIGVAIRTHSKYHFTTVQDFATFVK